MELTQGENHFQMIPDRDMELTAGEKQFLTNLLNQVNIRPAQPDAVEVVQVVKSILQKLEE